MSQRTKLSKSRARQAVGLEKNKSWKHTGTPLMVEVPTYSRAGVMYSKRVPFYKLQKKQPSPITDMINYLGQFFGGLFR